jgi:xylulokinase
LILAIDIGTSTFKAAIFDMEGRCLKQAAIPTPVSGGELDSGVWLAAFEAAVPLLGELGGLEALVISGNGPTLVPVTGNPEFSGGKFSVPAGKALLWLDRRAREESAKVSELAGAYVDPSFFVPKALWIKNQDAGLYEKTRHFLFAPEYLVFALTGEARTVIPSQGFERWYWDAGMLEALGLESSKFPPFAVPGECIGTVSGEAASRFGFSPGLKVFAGGPDFFVSILGTGVTAAGQVCGRSGSSEGINLCIKERISDNRLMSYGHPIKPLWNLSGIISTTGKAVAWARELLGMEGLPHESFYELAAKTRPGSQGLIFLPYLAGERAPLWDPAARGVFAGLGLDTGRAEMARAAAEGICFAIRDVVSVMEEAGAPARNLRVSGGPGVSGFLNQLKADVSGREVWSLAVRDAELPGNACTGAAALGKYGSAGEAAAALIKTGRVFHPDTAKGPLYAECFARYRDLYRSLKGYFAAAAAERPSPP